MATLYSFTSTNNNTGLNWNNANDNYAWSFTPTVSGVPGTLILRNSGITGTPTGNFYIKADKTSASATHGTATGVTLTAGSNSITLTGGVTVNSGTRYWVYFQRTSSSANYPNVYNEYTSPPTEELWRSSAINIDPDTRYDSGVKNIGVSMDLISAVAVSFVPKIIIC